MLFAPPPVSFSQQVAPILALHCNVCHGDSGGLSTRTFRDLMRGGNMGAVVIRGDPDSSLLIHFVDGRRGAAHRMPLGGRALTPEQIDLLRRWIAEGAADEGSAIPEYTARRPAVPVERGHAMRVFCRIDIAAYLTITVRDPATRFALFSEVASVKSPKDQADAGEPGDTITWQIQPGANWPRRVDVEVMAEHSRGEPRIELTVWP
jgi:hypothetical protein